MSSEPQSAAMRMSKAGYGADRPLKVVPPSLPRRRLKVRVEGARETPTGHSTLRGGQTFVAGALTAEERQVLAGFRLSRLTADQKSEKNAVLKEWRG